MGIAFAVAPAEAEHQLIYLQQLGYIKNILVNDSDYIALGGPEFRAKDVLAASQEPIMQRPIDETDVHENDSRSCLCSACFMFKTIRKVDFQKSDL